MARKIIPEAMNYFHDALLVDVCVDFAACFARLAFLAYPNQDTKDRVRFGIFFEAVTLFSTTVDMKEMKGNEFAGTVVVIREHERDQTTKIYLTGGAILIRSKPLKIEEHAL